MATEVILPRLGQGMESGTIVRWLKSEGDAGREGRAALRARHRQGDAGGRGRGGRRPAQDRRRRGRGRGRPDGRRHRRRGRGRARTAAPPKDSDARAESSPGRPALPEAPSASCGRDRAAPTAGRAARERRRVKASPLARRIARERGIDLAGIARHRPRRADRRRGRRARGAGAPPAPSARPHAPAAGEVERVPLTNIRKTIARRLTEAWQIPVFQLRRRADMTRANALAANGSSSERDARSATVTDVLTKVCARRAHAPPRGERAVHRATRSCSTRPRTSASPSPRRRASSSR